MEAMSMENYVKSLHGEKLNNIIAGIESMLDVALGETSTESLKEPEYSEEAKNQ